MTTNDAVLGLRDRSKARRLRAIQVAAEELFSERGFDAVTTKEIAERAEVGEATLFRYVSSKNDLLLLILGGRMDTVLERMRSDDLAARTEEQTRESILRRLLRIYETRADFYETDPANVTSYLWNGFRLNSKLGVHSVEQGDAVITMVRSILEDASHHRLLRHEVEPEIVALNCNAVYIHEVLRRPVRDYSQEKLWERLGPRLTSLVQPLFI